MKKRGKGKPRKARKPGHRAAPPGRQAAVPKHPPVAPASTARAAVSPAQAIPHPLGLSDEAVSFGLLVAPFLLAIALVLGTTKARVMLAWAPDPATAVVALPPRLAPIERPASPPPPAHAPITQAPAETPPAVMAPAPAATPDTRTALLVPPPSFAPEPDATAQPAPATAALCTPEPATPVWHPAPEAFGTALAAAAENQVGKGFVYTAAYRTIPYPMGDIPSIMGACSDVIIRAYRALGIDLQQLIHEAHIGGGDTNIDHRRTENLRLFFSRHGASLPISSFPEDYLPGDIVTYYRPFSRVSRAHIAIVSNRMALTHRPLIVHNRGYGPMLEDALFVDRITGHYRWSGPRETASLSTVAFTSHDAAAQRPISAALRK